MIIHVCGPFHQKKECRYGSLALKMLFEQFLGVYKP